MDMLSNLLGTDKDPCSQMLNSIMNMKVQCIIITLKRNASVMWCCNSKELIIFRKETPSYLEIKGKGLVGDKGTWIGTIKFFAP